MGVVLPHDLAHDARALGMRPVRAVAAVVHPVEDLAVHRLEPVPHIGQRATDDDRHRVVQIGPLHLGLQVDGLDRGHPCGGATGLTGGGAPLPLRTATSATATAATPATAGARTAGRHGHRHQLGVFVVRHACPLVVSRSRRKEFSFVGCTCSDRLAGTNCPVDRSLLRSRRSDVVRQIWCLRCLQSSDARATDRRASDVEPQMSRKRTSLALRWMNERRCSTSSPIRIENISSALGRVLQRHLEKRPALRVHRGVPQLVVVHLTEALVPLDATLLRQLPAVREAVPDRDASRSRSE